MHNDLHFSLSHTHKLSTDPSKKLLENWENTDKLWRKQKSMILLESAWHKDHLVSASNMTKHWWMFMYKNVMWLKMQRREWDRKSGRCCQGSGWNSPLWLMQRMHCLLWTSHILTVSSCEPDSRSVPSMDTDKHVTRFLHATQICNWASAAWHTGCALVMHFRIHV